jgi:hypothetical protein
MWSYVTFAKDGNNIYVRGRALATEPATGPVFNGLSNGVQQYFTPDNSWVISEDADKNLCILGTELGVAYIFSKDWVEGSSQIFLPYNRRLKTCFPAGS